MIRVHSHHEMPLSARDINPNEYTLPGGVKIQDKTDGMIQVIYLAKMSEKKKQPSYQVNVMNSRSLVFLSCILPCGEKGILVGCTSIIFDIVEGVIRIRTKNDADERHEIYAITNKKNCVIYPYLPKLGSIIKTMHKVQAFVEENSLLPITDVFSNQHGIVVKCGDNTIYWAKPHEKYPVEIEGKIGNNSFTSKDGNLIVKKKNGYYINGDLAQPVPYAPIHHEAYQNFVAIIDTYIRELDTNPLECLKKLQERKLSISNKSDGKKAAQCYIKRKYLGQTETPFDIYSFGPRQYPWDRGMYNFEILPGPCLRFISEQ